MCMIYRLWIGYVVFSGLTLVGPWQTRAEYPPLPETVTSFGAALIEDALYVYGGHTGRAHQYYHEGQAKTLWLLNLAQPDAWKTLGEGPRLQGLAMVADGGKLYRIGGFTAVNKQGEPSDLWSQADVARYDPATGRWDELTALPEPRSSFDAAVLDGKIYVIGGWKMAGDQDAHWHSTAHVLDLNAMPLGWKPLTDPPFQRRALSVAAFDGKIYAIGGMQAEGGPTTRVDIYDPDERQWQQGPSLEGQGMDGFGSSAFASGDRLYVSTMHGTLQRLAQDGSAWEIVQELENARFFHRMLPLSDHRLLMIGGANMAEGKFEQLEVLVP